MEDDLISALEEKGFNTFVAFGYPEGAAVERLLIDSKKVFQGFRVYSLFCFAFQISRPLNR